MGERGGWIVKQAQPFQRRPLRPRRSRNRAPRAPKPRVPEFRASVPGLPSDRPHRKAPPARLRGRAPCAQPPQHGGSPARHSQSVAFRPPQHERAPLVWSPTTPQSLRTGERRPTRARMFRFEHPKKDKHKPWQRRPRAPARPLPFPPEAENARQTLQPRAPLIPPRSRNTYSDTARPAAYSATTRFRRLQSRSLP